MCGMTEAAWRVMSTLSPRLLLGHSSQLFASDVTVRVFSCPVMSGDLVVKTTCSITDGLGRSHQLIEFSRASVSLLSQVLQGFPKEEHRWGREYRVWTSPATFARAPQGKRERSFVGLRRSRSRVSSGDK